MIRFFSFQFVRAKNSNEIRSLDCAFATFLLSAALGNRFIYHIFLRI